MDGLQEEGRKGDVARRCGARVLRGERERGIGALRDMPGRGRVSVGIEGTGLVGVGGARRILGISGLVWKALDEGIVGGGGGTARRECWEVLASDCRPGSLMTDESCARIP